MFEAMEFDAAVEVGIAAFCAGEEPPSDEEVWELLIGAGVEPWLAGRVNLAAEPVFVARVEPSATGRPWRGRADRAAQQRVQRDQQAAARRI